MRTVRLQPNLHTITGEHKVFGTCAVLQFAAGFTDDATRVAERVTAGPPPPVQPQPAAAAAVAAAARTQWQLGACATCGEEIRGGAVMELPQVGLGLGLG
jgi:hypothetical protein